MSRVVILVNPSMTVLKCKTRYIEAPRHLFTVKRSSDVKSQ